MHRQLPYGHYTREHTHAIPHHAGRRCTNGVSDDNLVRTGGMHAPRQVDHGIQSGWPLKRTFERNCHICPGPQTQRLRGLKRLHADLGRLRQTHVDILPIHGFGG